MQYILTEEEYQEYMELKEEPSEKIVEDEITTFFHKVVRICKFTKYNNAHEMNAEYIAFEIPVDNIPDEVKDMLNRRTQNTFP